MTDADRRRRLPALGLTELALTGLAMLVLGPVLLHRGVVLIGDMTFVPRQPWKPAWLGLDGSVPRAVPADAFVSVLSQVIPGDLLQKAILLGLLVGAGLGMLRLVRVLAPESGLVAALAAASLYLWNPYVHERLGIGHWGLLVGYAALPWVVVTSYDVRRTGAREAWARLVLVLAVAAIGSPTGGLLAAVVAIVVVTDRRMRAGACAVLAGVVVNLPWLVPGAIANGLGSDRAGVDAFAAHADSPLGAAGSLATFGGIWKQSVVAPERDNLLLAVVALLVSLAAVIAVVVWQNALRVQLLVLAAVGYLLALLPTTGPGADLVRALVEHVPGAGLLRDSQKWVLPLVLVGCLGFALVTDRVIAAARKHGLGPRLAGVVLVLLPLALLPSLAWGLSGRYEPVRIPGEWDRVARILEKQPADERRTVVLPFSTYQRYPWNQRAALDPAIRFLPGQVVTSDELVVGEKSSVAGDSPDSARIGAAIAAGRPLEPVLAAAGVRYVLLERSAAGAATIDLPTGTVLHEGPELVLLDLGDQARLDRSSHPGLVVAADILAGALVLGAGTFLAQRRIRRKPGEIG